MKIKIKIDREGLSSHTIKSEIYAQDIGGMIYIIMGTSPIASILQVTDAHKKRVNDKETGWKITGNVGNWSPAIKESYFDSYEQAIEKVIRYILRHPIEMICHLDRHYRTIYSNAFIKVTIKGGTITVIKAASENGNVYLPFRVRKISQVAMKKVYEVSDEFSGKRVHSSEGNLEYRKRIEFENNG